MPAPVRIVILGGGFAGVGQRFHSRTNVKRSGVGIDVPHQADRRMAHRGLGCSRRHTAMAQKRAETMSQSMHVHRSAPFVTFWDPCKLQIPIENLHSFVRHIEQRSC